MAYKLTGQKFGRLHVITEAYKTRNGIMWECRCECGTVKPISGSKLVSGSTRSCGCLRIERVTTHGLSKTPTYVAWREMLSRCIYPNNRSYPNYGALGISVCARWLKFINFHADMGDRPLNHSIDHKRVTGNYNLDNCKWSTKSEQQRNKRNTNYLTIDGVTKPMVEWCEIYDIPCARVWHRIKRFGWEPLRALTEGVRRAA